MKCKCSLNSNCKIIGLCDIEKFNQKIRAFNDKSWTQITLPEKLTLPTNAPNIKNIVKVYIDIKITSAKIIKTPISTQPNVEGLNLTGKILLTSGSLCQKIIYIADNFTQSMHSTKFNIPFNTYIVIDEDSDLENDRYCVYPCIEDVSVRIIDNRHLSKSVTLFLFAHKLESSIQNLKTKIIIKAKDNRKVATIGFNKDNEKFIVTSTGIVPDSSSKYTYFNLKLINKTTFFSFINVNLSPNLDVSLPSNENADNFKSNLDGKDFSFNNDILILTYKDKTKIEISNYPNPGQISTPTEDALIFEITEDGLVDKSLNSKIIIINDSNDEVANVQFLTTNNYPKVVATSTGIISTTSLENITTYVQFLHYSPSGYTFNGLIKGKENASTFIGKINDKSVTTGFPMKLSNRIPNRIKISNYKSQSEYMVGEEPEFVKILDDNLSPYNLDYNKITFKNIDNTNVLFIYFDKGTSYLFIHSTGVTNTDSDRFTIKITDSTGTTVKLNKSINKNQNADSINTAILENSKFDFNDILELSYSNGNLIDITDIPNTGAIYNPVGSSEMFKIGQNGLEPLLQKLENKITVKSKINQEVATIEFRKDIPSFIVKSTGIVPDSSSSEAYFTLILRNTNSSRNDILNVTLNSNQTAESFKDALNGKDFDFDAIGRNSRLILTYADKSKVEISNYPTTGTTHTPTEDSTLLKITTNGLVDSSYPSKIKIYNDSNNEVSTVQFLDNNIPTNVGVIATSTGATSTNALESSKLYAQLMGFDTFITINAKLFAKQNADAFISSIKNKDVNTGYPIRLVNRIPNRITITNYNNTTNDHKIGQEPEFIQILGVNVTSFDLNYNKIILKNSDNTVVLFIHFLTHRSLFFIYSTGVVNTSSNNFGVKILNQAGTSTLLDKSISINQNADSINTDNQILFYDDDNILELSYSNGSLVEITDIPSKGAIYNPKGTSERFRITENGLEAIVAKLPNAIILNNPQGQEMLKIEFNMTDKKLIATATDKINNSEGSTIQLLQLQIGSLNQVLNFGTNAQNFATQFNNASFTIGSTVFISYYNTQNVTIKIINYPRQGQNYTPRSNPAFERFKITQNALVKET